MKLQSVVKMGKLAYNKTKTKTKTITIVGILNTIYIHVVSKSVPSASGSGGITMRHLSASPICIIRLVRSEKKARAASRRWSS